MSSDCRSEEIRLLTDKEKKVAHRKLRKKAIKLQNTSSVKLSMAEALKRVANEDSNTE